MVEHWRPVEGHDGYEISSLGRARSLDRWCTDRRGRSCFRRGRVLRQWEEKRQRGQPYMLVKLGTGKKYRVHELVAAAFLGPRPPGQQTLHGPAGWRDNSVANLSYGSAAQNKADMLRDGTQLRGEAIPWTRLTDEQVREVRARHADGEAQVALAAEFEVTKAVVWRAIHTRQL